jgi:hypothetical protein
MLSAASLCALPTTSASVSTVSLSSADRRWCHSTAQLGSESNLGVTTSFRQRALAIAFGEMLAVGAVAEGLAVEE